jgi:hypothetical protein
MLTLGLSQEERKQLQEFVDSNPPGTAYWRRARILLLADSEKPAESIAFEVEVPVTRVHELLQVYQQQRLNVFPESILLPATPLFSPEEPMAEAGRKIMGTLLASMRHAKERGVCVRL